jgi:predicted glycoside hydrolase/deacetylase ChbG (UPF0249 family)
MSIHTKIQFLKDRLQYTISRKKAVMQITSDKVNGYIAQKLNFLIHYQNL